MMRTTVQIEIGISGTLTNPLTGESDEITGTASGSGVVYGKTSGWLSPVHSKILTANHVLDFHEGQVIIEPGEDGLPRILKLDKVAFSLRTQDGRICSLKPLQLGTTDANDTATADADCDAGDVAEIGWSMPPPGAKVYVSGHPLGIQAVMVTDGYVSGWTGDYLLISAPATHGNSGGPVFYNGKVIGLLVRGSDRFDNISLVAGLKPIKERIAATH